MRYIVLVLLLAGCAAKTNPKEAIVERQKAIKKEQAAFQDSAVKHALTGSEPPEVIEGSREVYFNRQIHQLQKEYDSLEVELKKY